MTKTNGCDKHVSRVIDFCSECMKEKLANARAELDMTMAEQEQIIQQLAEARAEIERKNETIDANSIMLRARETLISKQMKLIEQMREALNVLVASATPSGPLWHGSAEMQIARAALSAAERGE